ncbi:MAG: hypothetical protein ABR529_12135 [Actinomycetota bacterium]
MGQVNRNQESGGSNGRGATGIARSICALTLALADVGVLAPSGGNEWVSAAVVAGAFVVFVIAFAIVGGLVAAKRPANPIGWILSATALCYGLGSFSIRFSSYMSAHPDAVLPATAFVLSLGDWVWSLGVGLAGTFLLLLFPDGHLPSPRWRILGWLAACGLFLVATGGLIQVGQLRAAASLLSSLGLVLVLGSICGSVASLFFRFRSAETERASSSSGSSMQASSW